MLRRIQTRRGTKAALSREACVEAVAYAAYARPMKMVSLTLVVLFGLPAAAHAQDYVRPECRQPLPAFESQRQARWHRRFWTGRCDDLPMLKCVQGKPNWNTVADDLRQKAPPARRAAVMAQGCALGHLIAWEWARPEDVRRIDTADLRRYLRLLEAAPDVEAGLRDVERQARAQLAR